MLEFSRSQSLNREMMFVQRLSKQESSEMDVVGLDHAYCKPPTDHPDSTVARPARFLFCAAHGRKPLSSPHLPVPPADDDVNVDDVPPAPKPLLAYDISKAQTLMRECERHAAVGRSDESLLDLEDAISRNDWSGQQVKLFSRAYRCLSMDRLSRLAYSEHCNEPVLRRLAVDNSAKRMRHIFAACSWDLPLLAWLHSALTDLLPSDMMAVYLDVLQSLKSKVPLLIDKMLSASQETKKTSMASQEAMNSLLNRPWDPVINTITQYRSKKLPGNAIILMAPSRPACTSGAGRRTRFWHTQLAALGKVVTIHLQPAAGCSVKQWFETLVNALRTKIVELKKHFPSRPIVVVGWTTGAVAASYVCAYEHVAALVCLGFPVMNSKGYRGDIDDPLLDSRSPTLFVIGQHASAAPVAVVEDLREKMTSESGLIVVGGADNNLNVRLKKKKQDGITQAVVDRCIQDEIAEFLGSVLSKISRLAVDVNDSEEITAATAGGPAKKKRRKHMVPETGLMPGKSSVPMKKKVTRPLGISRRREAVESGKSGADLWSGEANKVVRERPSGEGVSLLTAQSCRPMMSTADTYPDVLGLDGGHASRKLTAAEELRQQLRLSSPGAAVARRPLSSPAAVSRLTVGLVSDRRYKAAGPGSLVAVQPLAPAMQSGAQQQQRPAGAPPSAMTPVQPQIRHLLTVEGGHAAATTGSTSLLASQSQALASCVAVSRAAASSALAETKRVSPLTSLSWLGGSVGPVVTKVPEPVVAPAADEAALAVESPLRLSAGPKEPPKAS